MLIWNQDKPFIIFIYETSDFTVNSKDPDTQQKHHMFQQSENKDP